MSSAATRQWPRNLDNTLTVTLLCIDVLSGNVDLSAVCGSDSIFLEEKRVYESQSYKFQTLAMF